MSQDHLLKDTGLLQAYSELVGDLMSQGTPEGDVFEYSARFILEFSKKQAAFREKAGRNYSADSVIEEEGEDSVVLTKPKRKRTKLTLATRQGLTPLHQKIGPSLFELTDTKPRSLVMQIHRKPIDYSALEGTRDAIERTVSIDGVKADFGPELTPVMPEEEEYDEEPRMPN
jgi:hypothetical protein